MMLMLLRLVATEQIPAHRISEFWQCLLRNGKL